MGYFTKNSVMNEMNGLHKKNVVTLQREKEITPL